MLPNNNAQVVHRGALPHARVGAAVAIARRSGAYCGTVLSFEFLVLTATRSAEVRGATWDEIDPDAAVWTIGAGRMKAAREHRVPPVRRDLAVLDEAHRELPRAANLVFPSERGRPQGHHPMGRMMKALGIDAVPHGFRSSFRDWAAECTDATREVCELALAHVNNDRVQAACRRSGLFERRRTLMQQWADYLGHPG